MGRSGRPWRWTVAALVAITAATSALSGTAAADDAADPGGVTVQPADVAEVAGVAEVRETPAVADAADIADVTEVAETPAVADAADIADVTEVAGTPAVADAADVAAEASEVAEASAAVGESGVVGSVYRAVGPLRVADTRQTVCGCTDLGGSTIRVVVAGRGEIPADAAAAAVTVTVAEARADGGYVTAWPAGTPRPNASVLNVAAGQTRSNSAIVALGAGGAIDLYVYGGAELIVDVSGAFVATPAASAGRLVTLDEAARVLDTRQPGQGGRVAAGGHRDVAIPAGVPADAIALAVNVTTTTTSAGLGYVTAWPAGRPMPESSMLTTDGAGQDRAAFAIVPVTSAGLSLYDYSGGHLIVDVVGWFTGASAPLATDGRFVPQAPQRAADTRDSPSPLMPGSAICVAAGQGAAIAANVTLTRTWGAGYATAWAAGAPMPATSNVNASGEAETVANGMIARRSDAGITIYGSPGTDALVDVSGWFTGTPAAAGPTSATPAAGTATAAGPVSGGTGVADAAYMTRPNAAPIADVCAAAGPRGFACTRGLDDSDLTAYFAQEHAGLFGGDYQRATMLPDGRVLWWFQDAMVRAANRSVRLVHNAALLQTGMCFTLVTAGTVANPAPWIGASDTQLFAHWWWPMGATVGADGRLHVFLMEMVERGASYLANPEPVATWVASIALGDLAVQRLAPAPDAGNRLYGWSITSDEQWTYLYGNCNRQFGWTPEGHDPCTANVYLAHVPAGQPLAWPEYRTANGWSTDDGAAVPVIAARPGREVNPSQVQFDGHQFVAVTKDSDWFGTDVLVDRAPDAWGPWTTYDSIVPPPKCGGCNTYFASWVPWRNGEGSLIIGLSHNRWNGRLTSAYRPTFLTVASPPM